MLALPAFCAEDVRFEDFVWGDFDLWRCGIDGGDGDLRIFRGRVVLNDGIIATIHLLVILINSLNFIPKVYS